MRLPLITALFLFISLKSISPAFAGNVDYTGESCSDDIRQCTVINNK